VIGYKDIKQSSTEEQRERERERERIMSARYFVIQNVEKEEATRSTTIRANVMKTRGLSNYESHNRRIKIFIVSTYECVHT
jgi:hypothetical protein